MVRPQTTSILPLSSTILEIVPKTPAFILAQLDQAHADLEMASDFSLSTVDAVADAMPEASQATCTTPSPTAVTGHFVTFTSSGRASPAKLPQKPQHHNRSTAHASPMSTPLRESTPNNPNITLSNKRPPLPGLAGLYPSKGGMYHEVSTDENDENSEVVSELRQRKLALQEPVILY